MYYENKLTRNFNNKTEIVKFERVQNYFFVRNFIFTHFFGLFTLVVLHLSLISVSSG